MKLSSLEISLRFLVEYEARKLKKTVQLPSPKLDSVFLDEDLSDVKIICQGQALPCHKVILSLHSDVFKAMFTNDMSESANGQVVIDDISFEAMKTVLALLYGVKVDDNEIDWEVMLALEKYNVQDLLEFCIQHLKCSLSIDNVMEILAAAHLMDCEELLTTATNFANNHRGRVVITKGWNDLKVKHPGTATKIMERIFFGKGTSDSEPGQSMTSMVEDPKAYNLNE